MKRLLICMLVFAPLLVMGQSASSTKAPSWIKGYFKDVPSSYIEVVSAFDYNRENAKDKAVKEIGRRRGNAVGMEVTVSNNDVTFRSRDLIVKARIIDEYISASSEGYTVYLLVQTAKHPDYALESVEVSDNYPFSLQALIPGMAQIHKGSTGKGAAIIVAEAAAVGGIIFSENLRASYVKKAKEQPKYAMEYTSKADNWTTARNVSIGVAAGVWIYNIIDAAVAKGTKRIKVKRNSSLSMLPLATPDGGAGVSFAYRF